jgi:hypothetical protein
MWLLLLFLYGCSQAAQLVQENEAGGVVAYAFKDDGGGPLFSRHRGEALQIVQKKCPTGYTIVREGEAKGYRSVSGIVEGTEDEIGGRRWGLQFRCKGT